MKFETMCRGCGTAYIKVVVGSVDRDSSFSWSCQSEDGVELPIEAHRFSLDSDSTRSYGLVTPLLDTRIVKISYIEKDGNGKALSTNSAALTRSKIKWASRFNYRFNSEEAHALRDIDGFTYSNQIHVSPRCFFRAPSGEKVLKGVICSPVDEINPIVYMLNGKGEVIKDFPFVMGKSQVVMAHGYKRLELSFSVRIPNDGLTYCIVADSTLGNKSGFLCLDPASQDAFVSSFSPQIYPASFPQHYGPRNAARKRVLLSANPKDFDIEDGPKFSIVVPLYRTPINFFNDMVDSVEEQTYSNWELVLVNSTPSDADLKKAISNRTDNRIRVIELSENKGIASNTNEGIKASTGDFVVFFDHDDTLDKLALYEYAKRYMEDPSIDAFYCDEDFLDENGGYVAPHYKSDFNIDLLRCHNYITHLLAVRSSFAKQLMLRSEFDGAQDYDFLLRLVEHTQRFCHVQEILYHWRISDTSTAKSSGNKNYADEAGRKALQEHYDRSGLFAVAELTDNPCFYHSCLEVQGEPLVSIIIPNKDNLDVLRRCIDSIYGKTLYGNFEVIIVENNSTDANTFVYYDAVQSQYKNIRLLTWENAFNYSAINNFAAKEARGSFLLFLNNDVEVIEPNWLSVMVAQCQRDDVGAVGAKLLYPDDTVQHAGIMMMKCADPTVLGGAIHIFANIDRDDQGYMRRASLTQDVSAVTAACMITPADLFNSLGGFSEKYVVAYNDVDYCLRVRSAGKLVVYNPDALLYHYESISRGSDTLGENAIRLMREQCLLRSDWAEYYIKGDPYHGPASTFASIPF